MKYHISSRHVSSPQDTLPQYEIFHWKCYIPEIHHSEKQRFLGVSRKLRFGFNSHFYRGIWVFPCGSFGGHSAAFSVEYVILEMDHWVIWVSTWFVIQSRLSNFACATVMEILENKLRDIENKLLIGDFLEILGCLLETSCRYWRITASMRGIGDIGA